MQPTQIDPQTNQVPSAQPQVAPVSAQLDPIIVKRIKNAGGSAMSVGIFILGLLVLSVVLTALSDQPEINPLNLVIAVIIYAPLIVLGNLLRKSRDIITARKYTAILIAITLSSAALFIILSIVNGGGSELSILLSIALGLYLVFARTRIK